MTVGPQILWVHTHMVQSVALPGPSQTVLLEFSSVQHCEFSLRAGLGSLFWPQSTSAGWSPQVLGAGQDADTQHTGDG